MKRLTIWMIAAALLAVPLTACGSPKQGASDPAETAASVNTVSQSTSDNFNWSSSATLAEQTTEALELQLSNLRATREVYQSLIDDLRDERDEVAQIQMRDLEVTMEVFDNLIEEIEEILAERSTDEQT